MTQKSCVDNGDIFGEKTFSEGRLGWMARKTDRQTDGRTDGHTDNFSLTENRALTATT